MQLSDRQSDRQIDSKKQTIRHTYTDRLQTKSQKNRPTDRQVQTDKQASRQIDRQTDRHVQTVSDLSSLNLKFHAKQIHDDDECENNYKMTARTYQQNERTSTSIFITTAKMVQTLHSRLDENCCKVKNRFIT